MVAEIWASVMSSFVDQLVAIRAIDILRQCLFVAIYHNLSSSARGWPAGNPPTIHAVLLLLGKHSPSSTRLFLSEHRATRSLHLSRSLAILRAPFQLTPISSRSSLNVLCHVFFGLALFLLSYSGTQYNLNT